MNHRKLHIDLMGFVRMNTELTFIVLTHVSGIIGNYMHVGVSLSLSGGNFLDSPKNHQASVKFSTVLSYLPV